MAKRTVDKSIVVARQVTRYFVYGRGYNSALAAHMQIAKHYVSGLLWAEWRSKGMPKDFDAYSNRWYPARYPAVISCACNYCTTVRLSGKTDGRGCWMLKLADYRQIAREIMSGERQPDGSRILALPFPSSRAEERSPILEADRA